MTTTTQLVNLPRTILGSLKSTFTAPSTCSYLGVLNVGDEQWGWKGQKCDSNSGQIDNQGCWPATTAGAAYPDTPFSGWGFYSPGLVCPAGHTSACTATASGNADWAVQFSLTEGETAVGCCPTGYTCTNKVSESGQTCLTVVTSTSVTTAGCDGASMVPALATYPYTTDVTVTDSASSTSTSASTVSSLSAWAPMIQINWRAEDRSSSSSATATNSGSSSSSSSTDTTSSSTTLSTGAVVGIVLGVVAVVAVVKVAAFMVWRKRRRHGGGNNKDEGMVMDGAHKHDSRSGADTAELLNEWQLPELATGGERSELNGTTKATELAVAGHDRAVELPG